MSYRMFRYIEIFYRKFGSSIFDNTSIFDNSLNLFQPNIIFSCFHAFFRPRRRSSDTYTTWNFGVLNLYRPVLYSRVIKTKHVYVCIYIFDTVYIFSSHLLIVQPMGLKVAILPVVTKDLPISPRFTPYVFLSRLRQTKPTTHHSTQLHSNSTSTTTQLRVYTEHQSSTRED